MESQLKPLQIPNTLLSKTRLQNKDTITSKNVFQTVGGNSFIQIEPSIAKFSGYDLNKDNVMTIRVINKAPIPQRLHILPPNSQFFSIKVDKKGILSTGMSESIELHFQPTEYKYYYETLKINTETQNFLVPIHAYPVLSSNSLREIIPKMIDFGTVDVGSSETNTYPLTNKVPLNFEFQFEYVKESPDIIVRPLKGVIPGKDKIDIEIEFTPGAKVTSVAEILLKVAQFDFEPLPIRIVGNGRDKDKKKTTMRIKPGSADPRNKQPRSQTPRNNINTLTSGINNTLQQTGGKRGRSSFRNSSQNFQQSLKPLNTNTLNNTKLQSSIKIDTHRKHSEREYLDKYNEVHGLDKEKDIKFFIYNGDKPMTEGEVQAVLDKRKGDHEKRLSQLENRVNGRYNIAYNSEQPIIERDNIMLKQPTYNIDKNDDLSKRRKLLKQLMIAGSKILVRNRMIGRLRKIQKFLEGCRTREDVARKVHKDAQTADQKHSSGQDYVKIEFSVSTASFQSQSFPLQFDESGPSLSTKPIKIQASTDFDDYAPVDLLQQNQVDVMNYTNILIPQGQIYLPKQTPPLRNSAQQQYPLRGPGLPTPQPIKCSRVMELPLLLPSHIFIAQDPNIKKYKRQAAYDEKDIEYLWEDTRKVEDELVGWEEGDREVQRGKFMRNLGCQLITDSGFVNGEIDLDVGNLAKIQKLCPKMMEGAEPDDPFSDADSDNDDYPNVPVQKTEDFIKKVEADTKGLPQKRQAPLPINQYKSAQLKMQKNAQQIKRKMLATSTTKVSDCNKWMLKPSQRLYL